MWRSRARRSANRPSAQRVAQFAVYALLGAVVGAIVAGLEFLTIRTLLARLVDAPLIVQMLVPGIGLAVASLVLRVGWRSNASTSDTFVAAFHDDFHIEPRRVFPKLGAAVATIGAGGALGMEGPSIFAGSAIGQWIDNRRLPFLGGRRQRRVMLIAGAAAGVAAVFRAPATGVLFALEAPYRRDIARHALIPVLVAASMSYVVFILILGAEPLFDIAPSDFSVTDDVLGAAVIGIIAGVVARIFATVLHEAKAMPSRFGYSVRLPLAGLTLGLCVLATSELVDIPVTLGPAAQQAVDIALDPSTSFAVLLALFFLRAIATSATLAGGGVGGVFVPLVVLGVLLGQMVGIVFNTSAVGLYPVVGLAAVLGAGYRTPLAAVMFVAETTGRAEFVIPALLATAVSQSLMGEASVSTGQKGERRGRLERHLDVSVDEATIDEVDPARPSERLLDLVGRIHGDPRVVAVPVIDDEGGYSGLVIVHDIAAAIHHNGLEALVGDAARNIPAVVAGSSALDAARVMNDQGVSAIAVVDDWNEPVGVVNALTLTGIEEIDDTG